MGKAVMVMFIVGGACWFSRLEERYRGRLPSRSVDSSIGVQYCSGYAHCKFTASLVANRQEI